MSKSVYCLEDSMRDVLMQVRERRIEIEAQIAALRGIEANWERLLYLRWMNGEWSTPHPPDVPRCGCGEPKNRTHVCGYWEPGVFYG